MDKRSIDFRYNLKVFWELLRRHKAKLVLILLVVLLVEVTRVADTLLFKYLIDGSTNYAAELTTKEAFTQILLWVLIIYAVLSVLRTLMSFLHIHLINRMESELIVDLKTKFFNHILGLSHNFHTTHKTGSLISRLVRGGSAVERMADVIIFNVAPLLFRLTVALLTLYFFSAISGMIVLVIILTYLTYSIFLQRKQEPLNVARLDAEDREKASVSDYFTNVDSIKYFGKERTVESKFKQLATASKEAMVKHWDVFRYMDAGQSLILTSGTLVLMLVTMRAFLDGTITVGSVAFVYATFLTLMGPLWSFLHGVRNFYGSMADFEVLFQYGKIHNEVKNLPHSKNYKVVNGRIELKNLTFAYGKRKIFNDLNLVIPAHKKVALVGHSGCGKTTLVKLLYRLYDLESGSITIDGRDTKDFRKEGLRREMSIVPQECVLFDDTIYNNIAFSKPTATKEEVFAAIKFAQLDKIIANFPNKEKTIVGERGVRLSGGEKQRVSIARAILADKKILVLDEATSALDSETEHDIQQDLERLMQGRTSIIIAHRLSTIMKADTIVVMEKGKIVQMGSHNDLLKQEGQYKKLWHLQKGGYIK